MALTHTAWSTGLIPLYDQNPSHRTPYVTYLFIALNILVFLYEASLGSRQLQHFLADFAVVPKQLSVATTHDPTRAFPEYFSVLSAMFMHAGFTHLGGNMLYLYIFGDNVEDRLGHGVYVVFYLVAGVVATLTHILSAPFSPIPLVGASGAIGGVLGCYAVLHPTARVTTLLGWMVVAVPAFYLLGFWFVLQALHGLGTMLPGHGMQGGTAWWAHIGGFIFGVGVGLFLKNRGSKRWR
jgi:membrane associated rhomboid family serine protease